jgi:hypothetical protein
MIPLYDCIRTSFRDLMWDRLYNQLFEQTEHSYQKEVYSLELELRNGLITEIEWNIIDHIYYDANKKIKLVLCVTICGRHCGI